MQIFGKEILVKTCGCNTISEKGRPVAPSVNVFVKVTKACNARCPFCANADAVVPHEPFNTGKLMSVIGELQAGGIIVNKLSITGGEPSVAAPLVYDILERMSCKELENIHLHLNTNGLLRQSQEMMRHPRWNSISMSLHHYRADKLSELYGCNIADAALSLDGIDKRKVNASCNLVRGYIDSAEEAHRMLDRVMEMGLPRIGFVALMPVNDYCRRRFVDLEDIKLNTIPHVYFTGSMNRGTDCKCSNFLYNRGLKILEIYMRNYANPNYCESSLVFDGEYLRQGFGNNTLLIIT